MYLFDSDAQEPVLLKPKQYIGVRGWARTGWGLAGTGNSSAAAVVAAVVVAPSKCVFFGKRFPSR